LGRGGGVGLGFVEKIFWPRFGGEKNIGTAPGVKKII